MSLRQFTVKVRLSGSRYNEVTKHEVSLAEVIVLRLLHGDDSVEFLEETDPVERNDIQERERIAMIYGASVKNNGYQGGLGMLIGASGPLPSEANGFPSTRVAEPEPAPKTRAKRKPKAKTEDEDIQDEAEDEAPEASEGLED